MITKLRQTFFVDDIKLDVVKKHVLTKKKKKFGQKYFCVQKEKCDKET